MEPSVPPRPSFRVSHGIACSLLKRSGTRPREWSRPMKGAAQDRRGAPARAHAKDQEWRSTSGPSRLNRGVARPREAGPWTPTQRCMATRETMGVSSRAG